MSEQPMPVPNGQPDIQSMVLADLEARRKVGIARYATGLQPFNGRDMMRDLYEELIDATVYVKGVMVERDTPALVHEVDGILFMEWPDGATTTQIAKELLDEFVTRYNTLLTEYRALKRQHETVPQLGIATNQQLHDELMTRIDVHFPGGLDYRAVDGG
jgi:hypothetical protein